MGNLRRHRGILRGSTTRLLSVASDILLERTQPSLDDLQEIIDRLRSKASALAEMDNQIADSLDGEAFDAEVAGAIDYREKIGNAISRLRFAMNVRAAAGASVTEGQLKRLVGTINESSNAIGAAHTRLISENAAAHGRPRAPGLRIALPKLQIPVLAGERRECQGFWEHYEATVHTHPDLADIENFQHLKTYLAGAAKRAIEGIRLTDANYKIAVKVLTYRCGRKDVLITNHIDSLLSIEPIEPSSQVSRLRDLYEQIQFRTGCLDGLGMPSAEYAVVRCDGISCSPLCPSCVGVAVRKRYAPGATSSFSLRVSGGLA